MTIQIKTFIHSHFYRPFLLSILIFFSIFYLSYCSKEPKSKVLAQIGNVYISQEEFELTYQYNPYLSRIQNTEQAKIIHLQTLIAEKMIALEGYRQSIENKPHIATLSDQFKREALIESLWQDEIQKNVTISENEVYNAYLKSKRTRLFNYLIFPNHQMAQRAYLHLINGISFSDVAQMNGIDPNMIPEDSVSFGSNLNPLESSVFQMGLHEISEPLKIGQYFFIIKHLNDNVDIFTSADDFKRQYKRIETIIRKRKQSIYYQEYIKSKFDRPPYNLNKQTFKIFVQKLEALLNIDTAGRQSSITDRTNYILDESEDQLGSFLENIVVDFAGGKQWTIKRILERLKVSPYPIIFTSPGKFRSSMIAATKMLLDDQVLVTLAQKADLEETNYVLAQSGMWTDYLVFQDVLKDFGSLSNSSDTNETVSQMSARLDEYLINLSEKYNVAINKTLFETLTPVKFDMVIMKTHFPQRVIAPVLIPLNNTPKFQQYISSKFIQN